MLQELRLVVAFEDASDVRRRVWATVIRGELDLLDELLDFLRKLTCRLWSATFPLGRGSPAGLDLLSDS